MRGQGPLFVYVIMELEKDARFLLNNCLGENPELFLIAFEVDTNQHIRVVLDGDKGVTLDHCMMVSRAIEHNLDPDKYDFSLEVTSAGVSSPLELPRQFLKNINRKLEVKTVSGQVYQAKLVKVDEDAIELNWKAREPKKIGKGKQVVDKKVALLFSEIKEAKVIITF